MRKCNTRNIPINMCRWQKINKKFSLIKMCRKIFPFIYLYFIYITAWSSSSFSVCLHDIIRFLRSSVSYARTIFHFICEGEKAVSPRGLMGSPNFAFRQFLFTPELILLKKLLCLFHTYSQTFRIFGNPFLFQYLLRRKLSM